MRFRLLVEVVIVLVIELLIALVVVLVAVRELKDDFYLKGKSEHRWSNETLISEHMRVLVMGTSITFWYLSQKVLEHQKWQI